MLSAETGTHADPLDGDVSPVIDGPSRFRTFHRLLNDRSACAAVVVIVVVGSVAAIGPFVVGDDPNTQDLIARLQGPSGRHLLGTDALGRDILSRLVDGSRVSLWAAVVATTVAVGIGVPSGMIAGTGGQGVDWILRTIADAVMSVPPLLLSLIIVGVLGPGLGNAMFSVGIVVAPRFFRIARGAAISVRHETYVEAARSVGCSPFRTIWRHVLPNTSGPLLVQTSFVIGLAIVAEASLSFLGLGVQPPQASWGSMVQQAYQALGDSTWGVYPPIIAIAATVLAFSLLGDSLRDALGRESVKR